jgi:hypothetical protein
MSIATGGATAAVPCGGSTRHGSGGAGSYGVGAERAGSLPAAFGSPGEHAAKASAERKIVTRFMPLLQDRPSGAHATPSAAEA